MVQNFYNKYKRDVGIDSDFDVNLKTEFLQHQQLLKKKINELRDVTETQVTVFRTQTVQTMSENQQLIRYYVVNLVKLII